jgi:hypothetical protein
LKALPKADRILMIFVNLTTELGFQPFWSNSGKEEFGMERISPTKP